MTEQEPEGSPVRPYARLGDELRRSREGKGVSLRRLGRELHTTHSNLHEYEKGFRLAPEQMVEGYERQLGVAAGTLIRLREDLAWAHGQGPAPPERGDARPTPGHRRSVILLGSVILVLGAAVFGSRVVRGGSGGGDSRVDLAAVGDRLAVGDFDGDHRADVAMASDVDGTIRILRWRSTGSAFVPIAGSNRVRVGAIAGRIAAGDVDGDGRDDVVMAAQDQDGTFSFEVWSAGSAYRGKWYTSKSLQLASVGNRLTVGDYNHDGKADVAMAVDLGDEMQMHVWASTGSRFSELATSAEPLRLSTVAGRIGSGDVTGDGQDDIVLASQDTGGKPDYRVWSGGSAYSGSWYDAGQINLSLVGDRLAVGDFTGDGRADVVVAYDDRAGDMEIFRWISTGSRFDNLPKIQSNGFSLDQVGGRMASGDIDGDGMDDIVMAYDNRNGTFSYRVWTAGAPTVGTWYTSTR